MFKRASALICFVLEIEGSREKTEKGLRDEAKGLRDEGVAVRGGETVPTSRRRESTNTSALTSFSQWVKQVNCQTPGY